MKKSIYVVYGTEENFYEEEIAEVSSMEEAEQFIDDYEIECGEYCTWAKIAVGEEEKEQALKEIREYREEEIAENF